MVLLSCFSFFTCHPKAFSVLKKKKKKSYSPMSFNHQRGDWRCAERLLVPHCPAIFWVVKLKRDEVWRVVKSSGGEFSRLHRSWLREVSNPTPIPTSSPFREGDSMWPQMAFYACLRPSVFSFWPYNKILLRSSHIHWSVWITHVKPKLFVYIARSFTFLSRLLSKLNYP